jgi:hypothetical protein
MTHKDGRDRVVLRQHRGSTNRIAINQAYTFQVSVPFCRFKRQNPSTLVYSYRSLAVPMIDYKGLKRRRFPT